MKLHGYQVEFLPLERRLLERRFIDTAPDFFEREKRVCERRGIEVDKMTDAFDFNAISKTTLTH